MRAAGNDFEQRACAELERAGLKLLARNYTTRHGELDLVMRDGDTIAFVEVRYRKNASHGDAAASVTASKQAKCHFVPDIFCRALFVRLVRRW